MSTTKNLWGELPLAEVTRTPATILREQATQLTELTKGLLEGEVTSGKIENNPRMPLFHRLSIIAPAMDNYKYIVMDIYHNIIFYPVLVVDMAVHANNTECENELEFLSAIEKILSSASVHKAVAALLSQSVSEQIA